jgi:hypothetical protein
LNNLIVSWIFGSKTREEIIDFTPKPCANLAHKKRFQDFTNFLNGLVLLPFLTKAAAGIP